MMTVLTVMCNYSLHSVQRVNIAVSDCICIMYYEQIQIMRNC